MKPGKAFELLVRRILINVGFTEVKSDGLYVFDGAPGQMIQGLGEAHNADVLLEPPVQTPFFTRTRLLIECKDYTKKIGLNTVRSALGLREDINHFEIVDINELNARKKQRRNGLVYNYERYSYQVAIVALNGYTTPAQKFAVTHRIPLLEFNKMPFWKRFEEMLDQLSDNDEYEDVKIEEDISRMADEVGKRMAVAITNSGQMLFLYREYGKENIFADTYSLYWISPKLAWKMLSGEMTYHFQLPDSILEQWLQNVTNDFEMRKEAINCKETLLSNMIVYYTQDGRPRIQMISIDPNTLERAKMRLTRSEE